MLILLFLQRAIFGNYSGDSTGNIINIGDRKMI